MAVIISYALLLYLQMPILFLLCLCLILTFAYFFQFNFATGTFFIFYHLIPSSLFSVNIISLIFCFINCFCKSVIHSANIFQQLSYPSETTYCLRERFLLFFFLQFQFLSFFCSGEYTKLKNEI